MKISRLMLAVITIAVLPATLLGQDASPPRIIQPPTLPKAMPETLLRADRSERRNEAAADSARRSNRTASTSSRFASIEQQIRSLNPRMDNKMLSEDEGVVNQAILQVTDDFKAAGFDETDAEEAVLAAWFYLRIGSVINFTLRLLVVSSDDLGKIIINSDPDQADITVGDQPTGSRTLYKAWLPAGTYKIKLSKPGYVTVEEQCEISQRKKTEFTKTLTRQP